MIGYVGFKPHRAGRIHIYCQSCKRKQSNMPRQEHDPETAVIVGVACERCSQGCKSNDETYRDERGRLLCNMCGRASCEYAGGRLRCDERIVNAMVARAMTEMGLAPQPGREDGR